jgi:hypothetical protein
LGSGNVLVTGGSGTELFVGFDTIAGHVILEGNVLPAASVDIVEGNTIGGNLICNGNEPPPMNQGYGEHHPRHRARTVRRALGGKGSSLRCLPPD